MLRGDEGRCPSVARAVAAKVLLDPPALANGQDSAVREQQGSRCWEVVHWMLYHIVVREIVTAYTEVVDLRVSKTGAAMTAPTKSSLKKVPNNIISARERKPNGKEGNGLRGLKV